MKALTWILSVLVALVFFIFGFPLLMGSALAADKFAEWGYGKSFMILVGACEMLGGILILIPRLAFYGAILLGVIMLGAALTHAMHGEPQVFFPIGFVIVLGFIAWRRKPKRD